MKTKKMWLVIIMFLMLGSLTAIDRTFTIDDITLQGIRDASLAPSQNASIDPLIWTYWQSYTRTTREYTPEELEMLGDRAFTDRFYLETNAVNAYTYIIRNDIPNDIYNLQIVRDYLHTFDWHDYKLAIHNPPPYENYNNPTHPEWEAGWDNMTPYQRGRELSFDLLFISYIIDMIYYAYDSNDPNEPAAHNAIMEEIITDYNDFIHWVYDSFFDYANWDSLGWESYGGGSVPVGICSEWQDNDGYAMPVIGTQRTNRMTDICGIGYGCIVTQEYFPDNMNGNNSESLISFVKNEFVSDFTLPEGTNYYGMQDYYVTNSGMYTGGLTYQSRVLYLTPLFFSALNRKHSINLYDSNNSWNCNVIKRMIKQTLRRVDPELHHITQEDDYRLNGILSNGSYNESFDQSKQIERGLLCYYYQNTDDIETRKDTRWYVHRLKDKCSGNAYPREWYEHDQRSFPVVMSFNPETVSSLPISNEGGHIPNFLSEGNYSDEELTVLRPEITENNVLTDKSWLVVNHENSFTASHRNDDKTSFQLYYKSKPFIISAGYAPEYKWVEWFRSSYAHNSLIVNPDSPGQYTSGNYTYLQEEEYLNLPITANFSEYRIIAKDPTSKMTMGYMGEGDEFFNPAIKEYLIENENINHLKVNVNYNNNISQHNTEENHPCEVIRNYYSFDDEYYVIFDEIENSDGYSNIYRNQIHLNDDDQIDDEIILLSGLDNAFRQKIDNLYLFGCMGATPNFQEELEYRSLPLGWTWWDYTLGRSHSRFSITTDATSSSIEQFLTLLIPSENDTNPIEFVENYSNGYGVNYDLDTNDPYETYAAVYSGDTFFRFFQDEMQFNTSADFFLIKTNEDCSDIKKLILNGDNSFEVHDLAGTRFPDVLVFDSDYDSEEVLAEWSESNELIITTLMSFTSPIPLPIPNSKYKILRCGVLPEDLISKTHYYASGDLTYPDRGTINNNIESLAYDSLYFYVNYSYSNLASENLLTSELTIHQGVFDGITIQGVTQFGTGNIVLKDEISVPFSTEIVFIPGSQPQLNSYFHLIVDGNLTALGTAENNIIFDKYSSTNWNKIEITNNGNSNMKFCKFLNAQFPLYNNGYVDIEYCEFLDNSGGIYLDNPTGYQINHSIINNCGYGILIKDSHILMYRSAIKNNLITNNNYGLWFYNASAYVEADTIFANKYVGIMANRGSNPVIVGSSISSTYYNSNDYPEIKISGSSYPIIDRNENDIIFGNGHSIYNMDIDPRDYRCSENWWGTTNELAISNSFYPLNWLIDFTPISQSPNVGYNPWSGGSLFEEGLLAESNGDLITAKTKYTQSIEENPESIEALWSVNRLINCSETEIEYADLLQYYNHLQIDYTETELAEAAKLNKIFCNRLLGNYQDAITEYEFLLDENLTFIDSVFTQLDIVYTYMEASSGGNRANVTFQNSNNSLSSIEQAEEREVELWSLLENQITDGGIYSPEISKSILHRNYPNPFNPSTTISFSILEFSKIQIMIYNIKGQKVKTVINESFDKGNHSVVWNGVDDSGRNVSSGVYFYNLNVNGKSKAIKKCLLLK